jgi:predicted transcriptional regulator
MGAKFSLKISSKWGICPLGFSLKVEGYFLSPVVTQRKDRLMSKKYKTKVELVPWMSARPDNVENRFIQVGNSLLFNKEFQSLGAGSQMLYLCMSMESAGKRKFVFPQAAAKKYKISPSSLRRHVDELEAKGFIQRQDPGFVCTALVSQDQIQRAEVSSLVKKVFGGSRKALFSALLEDESLSDDELDELRRLIDRR